MQDLLTRGVPEFVVFDALAEQCIRDRNRGKDQEHRAEKPQHQAERLVVYPAARRGACSSNLLVTRRRERRPLHMPFGALLVGMGDLQKASFIEGIA